MGASDLQQLLALPRLTHLTAQALELSSPFAPPSASQLWELVLLGQLTPATIFNLGLEALPCLRLLSFGGLCLWGSASCREPEVELQRMHAALAKLMQAHAGRGLLVSLGQPTEAAAVGAGTGAPWDAGEAHATEEEAQAAVGLVPETGPMQAGPAAEALHAMAPLLNPSLRVDLLLQQVQIDEAVLAALASDSYVPKLCGLQLRLCTFNPGQLLGCLDPDAFPVLQSLTLVVQPPAAPSLCTEIAHWASSVWAASGRQLQLTVVLQVRWAARLRWLGELQDPRVSQSHDWYETMQP